MSSSGVKDTITRDEVPWAFYSFVCALLVVHGIVSSGMFVSQMALFARVSDPAIGGTYMTLCNTVANLGGNWPGIVSVALVDLVTIKQGAAECVRHATQQACAAEGGGCRWFQDMDKLFRWFPPSRAGLVPMPQAHVCDAMSVDGFHVITAVCTVVGVM
eukprot:gene30771-25667_t